MYIRSYKNEWWLWQPLLTSVGGTLLCMYIRTHTSHGCSGKFLEYSGTSLQGSMSLVGRLSSDKSLWELGDCNSSFVQRLSSLQSVHYRSVFATYSPWNGLAEERLHVWVVHEILAFRVRQLTRDILNGFIAWLQPFCLRARVLLFSNSLHMHTYTFITHMIRSTTVDLNILALVMHCIGMYVGVGKS